MHNTFYFGQEGCTIYEYACSLNESMINLKKKVQIPTENELKIIWNIVCDDETLYCTVRG